MLRNKTFGSEFKCGTNLYILKPSEVGTVKKFGGFSRKSWGAPTPFDSSTFSQR